MAKEDSFLIQKYLPGLKINSSECCVNALEPKHEFLFGSGDKIKVFFFTICMYVDIYLMRFS